MSVRPPAIAIALGALTTAPRPAGAADLPGDADRVAPCRPTIACTADFAPPGTFEVEAGWSAARQAPETVTTFPLLLKQTLTPALQLQVGSNGYTAIRGTSRADFLDDVVLGPKLHLLDQGPAVPSLAVSAAVGLPTLPEPGTSGTDAALFTAYVSKDVGFVHADLNLGVNAWDLASPSLQEWAALALSATVAAPLGAFVEAYGFTDATRVAPRDAGLRAGITLTPRPWLVLDAGADAGAYPATRAYTVFAGLTVAPVVFSRPR